MMHGKSNIKSKLLLLLLHQYRPDHIQGKAKDVQIHETCEVRDIAPKFLNISTAHPRRLYPRVGSAVPRFVAQKVSRFCRF
jgi:hypothetical protein